MKLGHWQSFGNCTYTLFLSRSFICKFANVLTLYSFTSYFFVHYFLSHHALFPAMISQNHNTARLQNWIGAHIWTWNVPIEKYSKRCPYTLFLPRGSNFDPICAVWAAVSDIQDDCQNCHIWAWNHCKRSKLQPSFDPDGSKLGFFRSTGSSFWDCTQYGLLYLLIKSEH